MNESEIYQHCERIARRLKNKPEKLKQIYELKLEFFAGEKRTIRKLSLILFFLISFLIPIGFIPETFKVHDILQPILTIVCGMTILSIPVLAIFLCFSLEELKEQRTRIKFFEEELNFKKEEVLNG